jgi:putrescine aminotransferase
MDFGSRVDIRVTGLAIGLEFEEEATPVRSPTAAGSGGSSSASTTTPLPSFPALTISRNVVHEGLDILERCL